MLDRSPFITADWRRANASLVVLYVPHLTGTFTLRQQQCLARLRQGSPAFAADGGQRHFFVFTNDRGPCCIDGRYKDVDFLRHRVISYGEHGAPVHQYPFLGSAPSIPCFDPVKDISIPPPAWHTPPTPGGSLALSTDESSIGGAANRSLLLFFAGWHAASECRKNLVAAFQKNRDPAVLIRDNVTASTYQRAMRSARFCPICGGFAPWTPRLSEILYYECVPIFMTDNWLLPFTSVLDWSKSAPGPASPAWISSHALPADSTIPPCWRACDLPGRRSCTTSDPATMARACSRFSYSRWHVR